MQKNDTNVDLVYNTKLKFDSQKLIDIWKTLDTSNDQLCVTSNDVLDGIGSLQNSNKTMYDYDKLNPLFHNSYLEEVLDIVNREVGQTYRVRYMNMPPQSAYRLHSDQGLRYHIPLITEKGCYFIINDVSYEMLEPGCLYFFDGRYKHTAVNASRNNTKRLHLLFSQ